MIQALIIHPKDNVAVLTAAAAKGETVEAALEGKTVRLIAQNDIPIYHKIALRDIAEGELVIKYAHPIAQAERLIRAGEHVHTHNSHSPEKQGK